MGGMGAPTPASAVQGGAAAATAAPRPWLPASCGIPVAGRGEGGIWGGGWAGANGRKQMAFCQVTSTKFNFEFQIQTTYLIYHPPQKREPFRRCVEDENTTTESTCLAHHIVHVDPELAGGAHGEEELGDVVAEEGAGLGGQPAAGGGEGPPVGWEREVGSRGKTPEWENRPTPVQYGGGLGYWILCLDSPRAPLLLLILNQTNPLLEAQIFQKLSGQRTTPRHMPPGAGSTQAKLVLFDSSPDSFYKFIILVRSS